jgi:hypothetical protein
VDKTSANYNCYLKHMLNFSHYKHAAVHILSEREFRCWVSVMPPKVLVCAPKAIVLKHFVVVWDIENIPFLTGKGQNVS